MSKLDTRITKLENQAPRDDRPIWAEVNPGGQVTLRYQDGRRVPGTEADISGIKVYIGFSPDDWNNHEQP